MAEQVLLGVKKNNQTPYEIEDGELARAIKDNYSFETGIVPEEENIACLLISEDENDSLKDEWKVLFFKKKRKLSSKTITLDNEEELEGANEYEFHFYKELDANYEEVLKIFTDLRRKEMTAEESG